MKNFYSFTRSDLANYLNEEFAEPSFRASQLFQWVYQREVLDPEQMTNISAKLRTQIADKICFLPSPIKHFQRSQDGSVKYLVGVEQEQEVESVFIAQDKRNTLCVSSQVGCALGCRFCRTGTMGLTRHLGVHEIVGQFLAVKNDAAKSSKEFSNMVFMGMGEPLHNIENVLKAIDIITDDFGPGFSGRRITVSTVGMVPAIRRFFESGTGANLAVSLNATTNEVRSEIMPISKRYSLEELLGTLRSLDLPRRKRITIEYVMLKNVNDTRADLERLPGLLQGIPAKVNLIPYNTNAKLGFEAPQKDWVIHWQRALLSRGLVTTIRWSKGQDIDAACGQLRTESLRVRRQPKGLSLLENPTAELL